MTKIQQFIFRFLDLFYPLFKKFLDKETYHYLACGGGNTLFGLAIYFWLYHYTFDKQNVSIYIMEIKAHIAAFIVSFIITFPIGFFLSRYVVWNESNLPGKKQLTRHLLFVVFSVFLNYGLLKLFVDYLQWWAMPSQFLTTCIIVVFSYLTQKHISFKKH
jgi:putative flippase GtrA